MKYKQFEKIKHIKVIEIVIKFKIKHYKHVKKTKWFTLQYEVQVDWKSRLNIKLYQVELRQED